MNALRLVTALGFLALALLSPGAGAQFMLIEPDTFDDKPPHSFPPFVHWDLRQFADCTVPYAVHALGSKDLPYATCSDEIDKAFAAWAAVEPALIDFVNVGPTATRAVADDEENVLFWDEDILSGDGWDPTLYGGATAVTVISYSTTDGRVRNIDIVFDDHQFQWTVGTMAYHGPETDADDEVDGSDIREPAAGGNGVCDTAAIGDDVQVVPVGAAVAAQGLCVSAGPNGTLESKPNKAGVLDVWAVAAHEAGHFVGLGENNADPGAGAERVETFEEFVFLAPGSATLTFDIVTSGGTFPVAATFPPGILTPQQVAAELDAAIGGVLAGVEATSSGSLRITANDETAEIVITGGNMAAVLGLPVGESGHSTMNQLDPRGLLTLEKRTLSRADADGANFLYTPDLGDAPEPYTGPHNYPTLIHGDTVSKLLNGLPMTEPGQGAEHLFGANTWSGPRYTYEWFGMNGGSIDGSAAECEALITDFDMYDDGVVFRGMFVPGGAAVPVDIAVRTALDVDGEAHAYVPFGGALLVTAWFDWNNDGDWDDDGEHVLQWIDVTPVDTPSAETTTVMVAAPPTAVPGGWSRFRLIWAEDWPPSDYGVDVYYNGPRGAAQFGEVEDYRIPYFGDPWVYYSPGKVGSHDLVPRLTGTGPLTSGSFNQFDVENGPPSGGVGILLFGFAPLLAPVKGGVLGPSPALQLTVPMGPSGTLFLPFVWPGAPPGLSFWVQLWFPDPTLPLGLSATNTIQGTSN
ncbi:MAG: GEVED domain-containing protein [Planctomycetota bacterium]|jgi:hypothetical protein